MINGSYGAIIEKVKQGSVADLVGHLLPGDQVLEWNGVSLQGRSHGDVRDIIAASRQERSIELLVSRQVERSRRPGVKELGLDPYSTDKCRPGKMSSG